MKNDWQMLVNTLNITSSSQYVHQNNKPVLVIWGFGFTDRPTTADEALAIINYFKTQAGVSLFSENRLESLHSLGLSRRWNSILLAY